MWSASGIRAYVERVEPGRTALSTGSLEVVCVLCLCSGETRVVFESSIGVFRGQGANAPRQPNRAQRGREALSVRLRGLDDRLLKLEVENR